MRMLHEIESEMKGVRQEQAALEQRLANLQKERLAADAEETRRMIERQMSSEK